MYVGIWQESDRDSYRLLDPVRHGSVCVVLDPGAAKRQLRPGLGSGRRINRKTARAVLSSQSRDRQCLGCYSNHKRARWSRLGPLTRNRPIAKRVPLRKAGWRILEHQRNDYLANSPLLFLMVARQDDDGEPVVRFRWPAGHESVRGDTGSALWN